MRATSGGSSDRFLPNEPIPGLGVLRVLVVQPRKLRNEAIARRAVQSFEFKVQSYEITKRSHPHPALSHPMETGPWGVSKIAKRTQLRRWLND